MLGAALVQAAPEPDPSYKGGNYGIYGGYNGYNGYNGYRSPYYSTSYLPAIRGPLYSNPYVPYFATPYRTGY